MDLTTKMNIARPSVLISGASIAGLTTAWWMNKLGYKVTVVELAGAPRTTGAAVDLRGHAITIVKQMGIYEQLHRYRLHVDSIAFKNSEDATEGSIAIKNEDAASQGENLETERSTFINLLFEILKDEVEFIFSNSIRVLSESVEGMMATFKDNDQREFDLVIGCDGMHSGVRKIWFGQESEYSYFLGAYSSISIVDKLLIEEKTMQMYNEPDKAVILNAYNQKTDIIFSFFSAHEISYDYRNIKQQRNIIREQFAGLGWRTASLLEEVQQSDNFYFDKFCQIKMPYWTKGRVALVGDAAYCASPAAGMGASLSVEGAAALAHALQEHNGDLASAFQDYNTKLRPFIEEVQASAELNVRENFIPGTDEAIRKRNAEGF